MRRGQALIVVLMTLAVATAVGLSIVSRTTTEISISTTQEESARALSAAEAGVERLLAGNTAVGPTVTINQGSHRVVSSTGFGNSQHLGLPDQIDSGESTLVYLVPDYKNPPTFGGAPYTGNFYVCWGDPSETDPNKTPALHIELYYYRPSTGTYHVSPRGYDTMAVARGNGFNPGMIFSTPQALADCPTDRNYRFVRLFNLTTIFFGYESTDIPLILRLRLLYNSNSRQYIGLRSVVGNFVAQGNTYVVQGNAGNTSRKIEVDQRMPEPLPIFDNALFSGGTVVVN